MQDALKAAVEKSAALPAAKKVKKKAGGDLGKSLAFSITELPPVLVDHILQSNSFDTTVNPADLLENELLLDELVKLLSEAKSSIEDITSSDTCTGYIFAKRRENDAEKIGESVETSTRHEGLLYEDFHPFIPYKLQKDPSIKVLEFKGYNQTVDEFFSSLEGQKLEMRLSEREAAAKRKLEAARRDQAKRVEGLQEAQLLNMRKAAAIEANVDWVQEAMDAVNGLLTQGMDWVDIGKLVEREKKRNNPVASIISLPLNLADNSITLQLMEEDEDEEEEADPFETDDSDSDDEDDDDDEAAAKAGASANNKKKTQSAKGLLVEVNLALSPWSNAREYYDQRRTAAIKKEKTQKQATLALKNAEQKITEDLKKGLKQEKALLQPIRTQLWFEKFLWFISSDGYLVLGGKDASQSEILYKKHLRQGDVYCHADLKGAPNVIIKNNVSTPDAPIPPATLTQAGSLSVCASEAWDQKAGMGAWWVKADQVSKSAPTGEFLPAGSFAVRGQKNFLPPTQLLLGLGIMFRISDASKAKHLKHRIQDTRDSSTSGPVKDSAADSESMTNTANAESENKNEEEDQVRDQDQDKYGDETAEESEGDDIEKDDPRHNPLQESDSPSPSDAVDQVTEAVSSLQVQTKSLPFEAEKPDIRDEADRSAAGEKGEDVHEPEQEDAATPMSEASNEASPSCATTTVPSKKGPPKRGQKGKAKKMAAKYKDQDEEDRMAAEALIGATIGRKRLEAEAQAKAARAAELELAKERRRAQHHRQQQQLAAHEEVRRTMMTQGIDNALETTDGAEQTTALDVLVGTPLVGDEILEAIPVCAPWTALGKFKYKAKMQPGPVKKGKAVKEIVERWKADSGKKGAVDDAATDSERMWPREVELMKGMKVEEVVNCVPAGRVKVMMSGGGGGGGGSSGGGGQKGKGGGGQKGGGKGVKGGKGKK